MSDDLNDLINDEGQAGEDGLTDIRSEIESLREQIRHHNYRYYALDEPEISDSAFDELFRQLIQLESRYPELITPDSPTQRVGVTPAEKFKPFEHALPMLSLENAMSETEVLEFENRIRRLLGDGPKIDYVAEHKIDGLAVELVYENGVLKGAGTRGDGYVGEDVTQNVKTIRSIPWQLYTSSEGAPPPAFLAVRGEVYMEKRDFEALNEARAERGEPLFANPRNASAGSLRQLDSSITAGRPMKAFFYGVGLVRWHEFESQWEMLDMLRRWGLPTNPSSKHCDTLRQAIDYFDQLAEKRSSLQYEADGVVIKVNSLELQLELGEKSRSPRWAIAYKFPPDVAESRITDIIVQVGRTGALTPIALLEPVQVSGVIVKRATLHNQDDIDRKGLRVGDMVVVRRAGDVIPEVIEALVSKRTGAEQLFKMPDQCPSCGGEITRLPDEAVHKCMNRSCPAQVKAVISHFASRDAMDIEGLGRKIVSLFVEIGLLHSVADLYHLQKESIQSLPGFGEKSAQNLINSIEGSKQTDLARFLYALGIDHVGAVMAQLLAGQFKSLDAMLNATTEDLDRIPGVGEKVASCVNQFFSHPSNRELIRRLLEAGIIIKEPAEGGQIEDVFWKSKTVVFTGTLSSMTRQEASEKVAARGAKVTNAVSKNTDLVVFGENAGSKLDKAKKLGVAIMPEDEFVGRLGTES